MVMSYLVTSNAEYTQRIDEIELKIDRMLQKIEVLEYNINILFDSFNKELDTIHDVIRSTK